MSSLVQIDDAIIITCIRFPDRMHINTTTQCTREISAGLALHIKPLDCSANRLQYSLLISDSSLLLGVFGVYHRFFTTEAEIFKHQEALPQGLGVSFQAATSLDFLCQCLFHVCIIDGPLFSTDNLYFLSLSCVEIKCFHAIKILDIAMEAMVLS